jgi:hypothetical protein
MPAATVSVRENSATVAKEIANAGVKVKPYVRNPIYGTPNTTFSIAIDRDVVRVWAGNAKVKVLPDRPLKQAVLQVFEPGRKIQNTFKVDWRTYDNYKSLEDLRRTWTRWDIQRKLGANMPAGTTYSILAYDRKRDSFVREGDFSADYGTITVQGSVRATHQNFLIGKDEKSQFISALPRKAVSVKDAHDALRPAGVSRNALRQGEWFFVPATQAEKRAIKAAVESRGLRPPVVLADRWQQPRHDVGALESESSHHAPAQINLNNRVYAVGVVYDDRKGHHGSLILPDWHRVIRNREVVVLAGGNSARWD